MMTAKETTKTIVMTDNIEWVSRALEGPLNKKHPYKNVIKYKDGHFIGCDGKRIHVYDARNWINENVEEGHYKIVKEGKGKTKYLELIEDDLHYPDYESFGSNLMNLLSESEVMIKKEVIIDHGMRTTGVSRVIASACMILNAGKKESSHGINYTYIQDFCKNLEWKTVLNKRTNKVDEKYQSVTIYGLRSNDNVFPVILCADENKMAIIMPIVE